jgi:hypothetical protein
MSRPAGSNKTPGSGRKRGTPNKVRALSREIARAFVDDPAYREALRQRMLEGTAGAMETLLWSYGYGRPQVSSDEGKGTLPVAITIHF